MLKKIKEIAAPFKGHALLTVIWVIATLVLVPVVFFLPILVGGVLVDVMGMKSVAEPAAMFSIFWMLALIVICAVYAISAFKVKLLLFGSVKDTLKNIGKGLIGVDLGIATGILLIVPAMFFLMFKFFYAAFIGYICLMAMFVGFVLKHTIPTLKTA